MGGRVRGLGGAVPAGAVPVVEAALVLLSVAVLATVTGDDPMADWLVPVAPTFLALVVLGHRTPTLWRAVRGSGDGAGAATSMTERLWVGLEVLLALGFLVALALLAGGLVGSMSAAVMGSFDAAGGLLVLGLRAGILAAFLVVLLVLAVAVRLVVTGLRGLTGRARDG